MAATIKVVSKEDWPIITKYLLDKGSTGIILIKPEVAEKNDIVDGYDKDYDFFGDPDIWLDVISTDDHIFIEDRKVHGQ